MRSLFFLVLMVFGAGQLAAQSVPGHPQAFLALQPLHTASWHVPGWAGRGLTLQVIDQGAGGLLIVAHVLTFALDDRPVWVVAEGLAATAMRERDRDPYYQLDAHVINAAGAARNVGVLRLRPTNTGQLGVQLAIPPILPPPGVSFEEEVVGFDREFYKLTTLNLSDVEYVSCIIAPEAEEDEHAYCHAN